MASVPPFTDLSLENAPDDQRGWLDGIFRNLNDFAKGSVSALNQGLTFGSNMQALLSTFTVNVPDDWTAVTAFSNSWKPTNSGLATKYRKTLSGEVRLTGNISSGSLGSVAFNVPAAFRPFQDVNLAVESNGSFGKLRIAGLGASSPGDVVPVSGSNTSFSLDASWSCSDRTPVVPSCFPVLLKYSLNSPPQGVWPWLVYEVTTGQKSYLPIVGQVDWEFAAGTQTDSTGAPISQLKIRNLPGLLPNKQYSVTIVAVVG